MPKNCVIDSGALVALLDAREEHHRWARETLLAQAGLFFTCEAVLSETFFLLSEPHSRALEKLLRQGHIKMGLNLAQELYPVLDLVNNYATVPMNLADACVVRMSETLPNPKVITTDSDFKIYRRHRQQIVPCLMP